MVGVAGARCFVCCLITYFFGACNPILRFFIDWPPMSHKILDMDEKKKPQDVGEQGDADHPLYKVGVWESKRDGLWYWNAKLPSGENIGRVAPSVPGIGA